MSDATETVPQQASMPPRYGQSMRFGVLGPIEATHKQRRIPTGGPKQRTVLALLIANAGTPVSTDALIRGVYGDDAPQGSRRSIQTYVSNLRAQVGDAIESTGSGYRLIADRTDVDALVFDDIVAEATNGADPEVKATLLREALALWRGHPYADVDGMFALTTEIGRLNELRATAIEERVQADLDLGHHRDLVSELDSLTEEYPLRERFRAQQMLALYRSGRQAEALRAYERTRTYLVEELGLDPSKDLRELEQRILEQDPSLAVESGPMVRHAAILAADVADPQVLSSLEPIDRESLIQQQSQALEDATVINEGVVFAHRGSAMYASFASVDKAVAAAAATQLALDAIRHPMRVAVAVGEVQIPPDGAVQGPPLTRAAQLVAVAHGGQVLLSPEANQALVDSAEAGWIVRSLGLHDVDGSGEDRPTYQLVIDDLQRDFPPLRTESLPPAMPIDVRGLPGYELREQVGSGAFGVVHRAYQPSVGREVAVKIIRPDYANDPDFIRHFEVEAQLVARLEHPHIVPLHDYWRSPEGAYLVMRWLRGGTLQDLIASGPLSVEQADALVNQIAPALAFAHRHGVVHRDLKPSNILIDEDGGAYLSDFGVARLEATTTTGSVADDVRDLAGVVALALHGHASNEQVSELLATATTEDSPYGDVGSFVEAWNLAINDQPAPDHAATYTPTRNPYKGLQAFGELDAGDFHGRDIEIAEIIEKLRERRFVAVVGPSGIGKSSVTRAGAIPALRQGSIEGSEDWLITDMMPGAYPFEELTAALMRVSVEPPRQMEEELRDSSRGLIRYVRRYLPEDTTLLLVIDQFEELFTLSSETERTEFLAMLADTAADERSNVRVVITMRADFFDRPLRFAQLGDALREGTIPIAAPDEDAIRAMITEPSASVGVRLQAGLAERILLDVKDQPGALPLLEYTLTELFGQREANQLTLDAYDLAGGVLGAVGRRAESIYQSLTDAEQVAARQVFLRLVRVSESGRDTRRRVSLSELQQLGLTKANLATVLTAFSVHRLLTFDRDPSSRIPTVEVAHEAILTEWTRLADWVDERRGDLVLQGRLALSMADWEAAGRSPGYLVVGGRLHQHEEWTRTTDLHLSAGEDEFLALSRSAETERRARQRRTRNLVTAGFALVAVVGVGLALAAFSARSDAQQNEDLARSRELAASAIGVVDEDPELATLLALEAADAAPDGLELFPEAMIALREAQAANRLKAFYPSDSVAALSLSPNDSALFVVEPGQRSLTQLRLENGLPTSEGWVFHDDTTTGTFADVQTHPDGSVVALLIVDGDFEGGTRDTGRVDETGDDQKSGRVVIVDAVNGVPVHEIAMNCVEATRGPFYFSGDGSLLGIPQQALDCAPDPQWFGYALYDTATWTAVDRFERAHVTMSDDASLVLVDHDDDVAELRSYPDLELVSTHDIYSGASKRYLSPDGDTIVYRVENSTDVRPGFWHVEWDLGRFWGDGFDGFFVDAGVSFSPDGLILTPSTGADVLYDSSSGRQVLRLAPMGTFDSTVSSDGGLAFTAHADGVRVWSLGSREQSVSLSDSEANAGWLNPDFIDDGLQTGLWAYSEGELRLVVLDPQTGAVVGYRDVSAEGDQLPDGRFVYNPLIVEEPDDGGPSLIMLGPVTVWDPATDEETALQDCSTSRDRYFGPSPSGLVVNGRGHLCPDGDLLFGLSAVSSSDGRYVAALGFDPTAAPPSPEEVNRTAVLRIWDVETGTTIGTHALDLEFGLGARTLPYFGDGWIAIIDGDARQSSDNATFLIVDAATGDTIARISDDEQLRVAMEVSPDQTRAYFVTTQGTVVEVDILTWQRTREWGAVDARPRGLSLSPSGRLLAVGDEASTLTVWDISRTDPLLVDRIPFDAEWVSDSAWVDETTIAAAAMTPHSSLSWVVVDLDEAAVLASVREGLRRSFTGEECAAYHIDPCPSLVEMRSG